MTLGLLVGIVLGLALACGGAPAMKSTAPPTAGDAQPPGSDRRGEIDRLSAEITAGAQQLGLLPLANGTEMRPSADTIIPPSGDATCQQSSSESCKDICTLAESICRNAKRICEIAAEMNDDPWANGKCGEGKASCDGARTKCCGCT